MRRHRAGWLRFAVIYDQAVAEDGGLARSASGQPSAADEDPAAARPALRGVITDWGGVMTGPVLHTVDAWLEAERIDRGSYLGVMGPWVARAYGADSDDSPIHALERGEISNEEFERLLAEHLVGADGLPVPADGLLTRMFAASVADSAMHDLMRSLRRAGLRTALLSNSWGSDDYPRQLFPELFDAVVISAEVGMRKPEERIFRLAADLLGLEPRECVFIDDIEANVLAAEAIGLIGVHHRESGQTVERLCELLGMMLP
jgi:putative hydrolase of the HAD superfamily